MKILKNPSRRLLQAIGLTPESLQYERTCHSSTCCCASHDSGYHYVEVEDSLLEGVEIHHYSGNAHSHGSTVLREEHVKDHTAKGLPKNAPEWAYTLESRNCQSGVIYTGSGVDVVTDGDFTVVKLMTAFKYGHRESELFATKDGISDHTKEYRRLRFEKLRDQRIAEFTKGGLTTQEANRLFQIGKEQWTREQEPWLIAEAQALRDAAPYYLNKMACSYSNRDLSATAHEAGVLEIISGMSHPRATAFTTKALWVFHGKKAPLECGVPAEFNGNSLAKAFAHAK